jgi:hypothetical protein
MDGFADVQTDTMYLNKRGLSATNTVHEMLHLNAAEGFGAAVGESLSEGTTEYLAIKAITATDIQVAGKIAYPDAVALVTRLVNLSGIGADTLVNAYCNGADILIAEFDALKGAGAFAALRAAAELKDWAEAGMLVGSAAPAPGP